MRKNEKSKIYRLLWTQRIEMANREEKRINPDIASSTFHSLWFAVDMAVGWSAHRLGVETIMAKFKA